MTRETIERALKIIGIPVLVTLAFRYLFKMKFLKGIFLAFSVFLSLALSAQKTILLASPDQKIQFTFRLHDKIPAYSVSFKGKTLIENSELSLSFGEGGPFRKNIEIDRPVFREADEVYELVVGKTKNVKDHFKEVMIPMVETVAPFRQVNLLVRAFNDGVALRYELPLQKDRTSITLTDESTTFRFTGNPTVNTMYLPNFTTSHEGKYHRLPLSEVVADTLMELPTLIEFPGSAYLAITEAALVNYAGMYLTLHRGVLTSTLSPWPGQRETKVKATLPHRSPWRVLMISDRVGALIESNILTDLNEPCKIQDLSWIKPGKTTWPWWNGNVVPDTSFAPGNNFETQKYYIDFCARNGIAYHSVVEYGLNAWYVNDGDGFAPGPHTDVTKPVAGLDMQKVCDYAKQQGVGIRVWVHWAALYPQLEKAFVQYEKWGIKGMMVDFMDRDDQQMVNIQEEILKQAASHHLHIQFHGAYKPTGMQRTYPNEFTREGTLNYEVNKWASDVTPDHDMMIPFTRMLAGSTDYHLGGFRAVPESKFKVQYTRPLMMGTRCHSMAMYVVLENYLGMVCDYPSAYEGQPGFEFIKMVPTVWDETRVLDARVGEYIVIARRKNADWYVGAITNHERRQLTVSLSFLGNGKYEAEFYKDAPDTGENPNHLIKETHQVEMAESLSLSLAPGGGAALILKRK